MTETLIVSKEHDSFFREACKDSKIDFELTGEGIDGDSYTVKYDHAGELYYLGRAVQNSIAKKMVLDKLKSNPL